MKEYLFITLLLISSLCLAQSNEMRVFGFNSPQNDFNYPKNANVEIKVIVKNDGPSIILGTDSIHFDYKIATNDTTVFLTKKMRVNQNITVGDFRSFVLDTAYNFSVDDFYNICASISRTDQIPTNASKNPQKCIPFIVGIENLKNSISKYYFNSDLLTLDFNKEVKANYTIYDLTGKTLKEGRINGKRKEIILNQRANGIYFIKIQDNFEQSAILKFIAN